MAGEQVEGLLYGFATQKRTEVFRGEVATRMHRA